MPAATPAARELLDALPSAPSGVDVYWMLRQLTQIPIPDRVDGFYRTHPDLVETVREAILSMALLGSPQPSGLEDFPRTHTGGATSAAIFAVLHWIGVQLGAVVEPTSVTYS